MLNNQLLFFVLFKNIVWSCFDRDKDRAFVEWGPSVNKLFNLIYDSSDLISHSKSDSLFKNTPNVFVSFKFASLSQRELHSLHKNERPRTPPTSMRSSSYSQ